MSELEHAKAETREYLRWALPDIQRDPDANKEWRRIAAEREAFGLVVATLPDGMPVVHPAWEDERGEALVVRARGGDPAAHRALLALSDGWLGKHPLPPALSAYVSDQYHGRGPKLRRGSEPNEDRARHIVAAVQRLVDQCGSLTATRNEASDQPSACMIVAEILVELGESIRPRAVEDIWRNRERSRPGR